MCIRDSLRTGQNVRLMASGAEYEVLECGYLKPLGMEKTDALMAGEVGYFTASIKNVADTRVGDTITEAERPAAEPLPGYKAAQPMAVSYTHLDVYKRQPMATPTSERESTGASLTPSPTKRSFSLPCLCLSSSSTGIKPTRS